MKAVKLSLTVGSQYRIRPSLSDTDQPWWRESIACVQGRGCARNFITHTRSSCKSWKVIVHAVSLLINCVITSGDRRCKIHVSVRSIFRRSIPRDKTPQFRLSRWQCLFFIWSSLDRRTSSTDETRIYRMMNHFYPESCNWIFAIFLIVVIYKRTQ